MRIGSFTDYKSKNISYNYTQRKVELLIRSKKILLALLLLLISSFNPGAVENPGNLSGKMIPGSIRLTNSFSSAAEFAGCDKIVESFMKKWTIEGASVAIAKDGKLLFARGFGLADTATGIETQPYSKFRIASISKLVTAIAIHETSGRREIINRR